MNQFQIPPSNIMPDLSDHDAILATVHAETDAFLAVDFARWANCWVQEKSTQVVYSSGNAGIHAIKGWDAISAHMTRVFEKDLVCKVSKIDPQIKHVNQQGDMAWVAFDSISEYPDGTQEYTLEARVLERHSGAWKIAYASIMQKREPGADDCEVSVDKDGQVICANAEALEILKVHPLLTISAGRLRAHKRSWDKILQEQINNAGKYHGFFELARFTAENGALRYPVLLGEDDDGGVALVFFTVRDSMTYVQIAGQDQAEHRLAVAQAVFGLSDGQMRVANRIAAGQGLQAIADELDISVNTARTHLSRIFEKTGVNTQTALVRLLLSVG